MTKFSSRHFSLVYVPRDLDVLKTLPPESFLRANDTLKKNVLFNSHPDFIVSALFLSLGLLGGL